MTDRHTDRQTPAILLSAPCYAIAMGQIKKISTNILYIKYTVFVKVYVDKMPNFSSYCWRYKCKCKMFSQGDIYFTKMLL